MVKRILIFTLCLLSVMTCLSGIGSAASAAAPAAKPFWGEAFGTEIEAVFYGGDEQKLESAFNEILTEFRAVEEFVSVNLPESDIDRFNKLEADSAVNYIDNVHPFTVELLKEAKRLYSVTGGAFNPCAYLLNDLWQLSGRFHEGDYSVIRKYDRDAVTLPEQKYIDAFKNLMDFDTVVIEEFSTAAGGANNRVYKTAAPVTVDGVKYDMQIDLNGIAKGFAGDRAKLILELRGITSGYISVGGSSLILLDNPETENKKWSVGLADPEQPGYTSRPYIKTDITGTLSTSGDYQAGNYYMLGKTRYCHIMDTGTGSPIQTGIRTASVYGESLNGTEADALSTAVMAMGFENAKAFVNSRYVRDRNIKIIFVYQKKWTLGSVFEIVTNAGKGEAEPQSLDYRLTGFTDGSGQFVYNPLRPDLWFWLTAGVLITAAAAFLIIRKIGKTPRIKVAEVTAQSLRGQKFFLKKDIIVYVSLAVLVAALLTAFVFTQEKAGLTELRVYHRNVLIFTFDLETRTYQISADFSDKITITNKDGIAQVEITTGGHYNLIEIGQKTVKMEDADCSRRKDCVTAFTPIKYAGQTIICRPHFLKLVGSGAGDYGFLPNG